MQHAIARQAEAERERRAKIINAEGEAQAAARLADAADVIGRNPVTFQLRYLQTLREVSNNPSSTIVFPPSIDVLRPLLGALGSTAPRRGERERARAAVAGARAGARRRSRARCRRLPSAERRSSRRPISSRRLCSFARSSSGS